jgi:hypothetical protein
MKENLEFNVAAMKNLVKKDRYLSFIKNDLSIRNLNESEEYILQVLFNSNVLDNSSYETAYKVELENQSN